VTLWQELPGQKKYERIASTDASTNNSYTFKMKAGTVMTNRLWYVTNGSQQSLVDAQRVQASVTARDVGGIVSGRVRPSHAGERVLVERGVGAEWSVVRSARLSKHSRYRVRIAVAGASPVTLRVHLPADARNTDSFSKTFGAG
jgi:hypothetical protein